MTSSENPKLIAYYLPQFHPTPENDTWWGKGFTEWTNMAKARPLFKGHYQPHIPADMGFYDLRVPETRQAQADLASSYGIDGFCYYHYWFAGKRMLERPFNEVLASGKPDLPFCLCWANHHWTGIWMGLADKIFLEQTYPGDEDTIRHFYELLPAFKDSRYMTVNGKPIFSIFDALVPNNWHRFSELWQELAIKNGLPGIHLVALTMDMSWDYRAEGFDAAVTKFYFPPLPNNKKKLQNSPTVYLYENEHLRMIAENGENHNLYDCVFPGWDNTPRSGTNGTLLHGATPELFRAQVRKAFNNLRVKPAHSQIIFIKAWNEWATGNHMEPDLRFGHQYLEVIKTESEAYGRAAESPGTASVVAPHKNVRTA